MKFIKSQISKYIISILLKPEWLGRVERCFTVKKKQQYIQIITKHISKVFDKVNKYKKLDRVIIKLPLNSKNIQFQSLLKTINSNQTVSKYLYVWFNSQNFICNNIITWHFIHYTNRSSRLYELFEVLYYLGLEWHIYTNSKMNILYLNLYLVSQTKQILCLSNQLVTSLVIRQVSQFMYNKMTNLKCLRCSIYRYYYNYVDLVDFTVKIKHETSHIIKPSKQSIQYIFDKFRYILYHRDIKGHWKINSQVKINRPFFFINHLLKSWYIYYSSIVNKSEINRMNYNIDNLFYSWQTKKQK